MKAKRVYEALGDVLKPKTETDFLKNLTIDKFEKTINGMHGSSDFRNREPILFTMVNSFRGSDFNRAVIALYDRMHYMNKKHKAEFKKIFKNNISNISAADFKNETSGYEWNRKTKEEVFVNFVTSLYDQNIPAKEILRLINEIPNSVKNFKEVANLAFRFNPAIKTNILKRYASIVKKEKTIQEIKSALPSNLYLEEFIKMIKPHILKMFSNLSLIDQIKAYNQFMFDEQMGIMNLDKYSTVDVLNSYLAAGNMLLYTGSITNNEIRVYLRKRKDFKDAVDTLDTKQLDILYNADKSDKLAKYAREKLTSGGDANEMLMRGLKSKSPHMIKKALENGADQLWYMIPEGRWFNSETLDEYEVEIIRLAKVEDGKVYWETLEDNGTWKSGGSYVIGSFLNNYKAADDYLSKYFAETEKTIKRNEEKLERAKKYLKIRKDFINKKEAK